MICLYLYWKKSMEVKFNSIPPIGPTLQVSRVADLRVVPKQTSWLFSTSSKVPNGIQNKTASLNTTSEWPWMQKLLNLTMAFKSLMQMYYRFGRTSHCSSSRGETSTGWIESFCARWRWIDAYRGWGGKGVLPSQIFNKKNPMKMKLNTK